MAKPLLTSSDLPKGWPQAYVGVGPDRAKRFFDLLQRRLLATGNGFVATGMLDGEPNVLFQEIREGTETRIGPLAHDVVSFGVIPAILFHHMVACRYRLRCEAHIR